MPRTHFPTLLDLCLFVVCKNGQGDGEKNRYLSYLPDFPRKRLGELFKHEEHFQQEIQELNFSYCHSLVDDELEPVAYLKNLKRLNLSRCDKLTAIGLSFLQNLPNLEVLKLNNCTKLSVGLFFSGKFASSNNTRSFFL